MKITAQLLFPLLLLIMQLDAIPMIAQAKDDALFNCMQWRSIGPFRGGRTVGACGDLQHPNIFYVGVNNGGVWKTTDYGRTWNPIFDDQPTGSIGDVALSPSNPSIIYVGSGEGLQRPDLSVGDGIYKSTDAGKSWVHLGLREGMQIGGLAINPSDENNVFAAVLGHPYSANTERGIFRTKDGGKTWERVLYTDENTGAIQVTIDPQNPNIVFADMLAARMAPWENGEWLGKGSGLFKSIDGGNTWKQLKTGLPTVEQGLGRIGFCIAPSNHNKMYAVISSDEQTGGFYKSDDGGESWTKINADPRLWDRGIDFGEVKVDPNNENIVYSANVVVWKSIDGGKTWSGFKGAPGGDDYHRLWINTHNSDIILCTNDQGAIVTVNGGTTWSSWYNQPTAQLYHVSADNAFPYNVYSGQQESGSVGIASRGNDGAITFRDWHSVSAEEYGYVVADPLNPNIVYGGKISRYDKRTGQSQDISPEAVRTGKYRFIRTAPILFSPIDNKTLFYAGNVIFKTHDEGRSWKIISPDLTRETYDIPECVGIYKKDNMKTMPRRGVIYTIALSPLDSDIIWAGTDDGLIWITNDGGQHWSNTTPSGVSSWSKVSLMDASHTDKNTVYAAINRIRLDDMHPHIYRTRDGGKTWVEIVTGLPDDPINVVKEDPICKGLLYAGSERAVYVSFDDGDHWQTLRLNMPATSIRDLTIKDNDIIVATHGRSFWILDDITPLRQLATMSGQRGNILYKPQTAIRVRWNMNTDTPLPPDEPVGKNPPDGAIIDYYLDEDVKQTVVLEITDAKGNLVHRYSSDDTLLTIPDVNIPLYWVRPQQILSSKKGSHRLLWDMRYMPLNILPAYPMNAIYGDTPPEATAPWVMPGKYFAQLIVNGNTTKQEFQVVMDPRVKTSLNDLQIQRDQSYKCYYAVNIMLGFAKELNIQLYRLNQYKNNNKKGNSIQINELEMAAKKLLQGDEADKTGNLNSLIGQMRHLFNIMQHVDVAPTTQCLNAVTQCYERFIQLENDFDSFETRYKKVLKYL